MSQSTTEENQAPRTQVARFSIRNWNPNGPDLQAPKDPDGYHATDRAKGCPAASRTWSN